MGDDYDARVTTVTPDDLGDHVRGLAAAGATHLQLVLDPITAESIDLVGEALAGELAILRRLSADRRVRD